MAPNCNFTIARIHKKRNLSGSMQVTEVSSTTLSTIQFQTHPREYTFCDLHPSAPTFCTRQTSQQVMWCVH